MRFRILPVNLTASGSLVTPCVRVFWVGRGRDRLREGTEDVGVGWVVEVGSCWGRL